MQTEAYKIYVDRLGLGKQQAIDETIEAKDFPLKDDALRVSGPLYLKGEAYIAQDQLVLHLRAQIDFQVPCAVCNNWADLPIQLEQLYITEPLAEIRGGVFDFEEKLREELLLAVPYVYECGGKCPRRSEIKEFLKEKSPEGDRYHPFADL